MLNGQCLANEVNKYATRWSRKKNIENKKKILLSRVVFWTTLYNVTQNNIHFFVVIYMGHPLHSSF